MSVITNIVALDRKRGGVDIRNYAALIHEGFEPLNTDGLEFWHKPTRLRSEPAGESPSTPLRMVQPEESGVPEGEQ